MGRKTENDHDEAARLDREYTGDSVNARTDELKKELKRETDQLQRKYEESEKPEADSRED
ncbi:MAG: hypothetical protein M3374_03000 [Pseudomonadota bacterium]|nr:hypothetical protein [Pseudomonadota bacterium]